MDNSTATAAPRAARGPKLSEPELRQAYAKMKYGNNYEINFPITLVICVFGLVTNIFNIIVFSRKHMFNSSTLLLLALAVADILLILSQIPYTVHYLFSFRSMFDYSWVQFTFFLLFLELFSMVLCNWLAVIIGIWRSLIVAWPAKSTKWCSMLRAKIALAVLVLFGLALSLPIFPLQTTKDFSLYNKTLYTMTNSEFALKNDGLYKKAFWHGLTLITFVPCVLLIIIDVFLIVKVWQLRRSKSATLEGQKKGLRRNYRVTVMITIILVLFLINNLPDASLVLVRTYNVDMEETLRNATDWLRMLSMVNNAVSFFVYYFFGERKFRSTFKNIFCFKRSNEYAPGDRKSIESTQTESEDDVNGPGPRINMPLNSVTSYERQ